MFYCPTANSLPVPKYISYLYSEFSGVDTTNKYLHSQTENLQKVYIHSIYSIRYIYGKNRCYPMAILWIYYGHPMVKDRKRLDNDSETARQRLDNGSTTARPPEIVSYVPSVPSSSERACDNERALLVRAAAVLPPKSTTFAKVVDLKAGSPHRFKTTQWASVRLWCFTRKYGSRSFAP